MKRKQLVLITLIATSVQTNAEVAVKPGRWLDTSKSWIDGVDVDAQSKKSMDETRARIPADQRAEFDRMMAEQGASTDDSQEYQCIKPEDVVLSAQEFMTKSMHKMSNDGDGSQLCTFSDQHADATKISYKFICGGNAQGGQSKGQVQMEFAETSYHMEVSGSANIPVGEAGAKLMKSRSVSDGKWVSAKCQPNDVRISLGSKTNKEK